MNRRAFLKATVIALGGTALACSGLGIVATRAPDIALPESEHKGRTEMGKILIAYASKSGSTAEVAEFIAETLNADGWEVDVRRADQAGDPKGYDAVVVGSGIRAGRPLGEAVKFAESNKEALQGMPTACFALCATLAEDTPETRQTVEPYLDPLRQAISPQTEAIFAGVVDPQRLALLARLLMKAMKAPQGDFRDWDAIRAWAEGLPSALLGA